MRGARASGADDLGHSADAPLVGEQWMLCMLCTRRSIHDTEESRMSAENEALVRRFFEEFCNGRRGELADELVTADYVSHGPQAPPAEGPDGVRDARRALSGAVDGHWDVQELMSRSATGSSLGGSAPARIAAS